MTTPMKETYRKPSVWMPLVIAVSLGIGILLGTFIFSRHASDSESPAYEKLRNILEYISENYVDEVSIDSILEKTFPEILAQLDPHSTYIPASELQSYNIEIEGSFSGIGIRFNTLTDTITVDEVISGGPSEKVGIIPGDRIVTVNDTLIIGDEWTNERLLKILRGPRFSEVTLGIKRSNSDKLLKYTVTRDEIPVTSVDACYMITPTTGYLKINTFSKGTYDEFLTSLVNLRKQGAKNYILDLRGNGGGLMEEAVRMANEFLSRNDMIVSMRGRLEEYNAGSSANGLGSFQNEQLAVLIDETSASASEILAGAIQDNDRGLIVGRRSFGKGLVQTQIDLPDQSAMRLTVARYYTPSGRCIQKNYIPGSLSNYANEIAERYMHGENFSADSIRIDKSQVFLTSGGREVYGGGGIIPDIFVANDTIGITDYYISIYNAGLLQKFSFTYTDSNRERFADVLTTEDVLAILPSDDSLLTQFVSYAQKEGKIAPRWFYINQSRDLIVNILKALIARDLLGTSAYYEVINRTDSTIKHALDAIGKGHAKAPVTVNNKSALR